MSIIIPSQYTPANITIRNPVVTITRHNTSTTILTSSDLDMLHKIMKLEHQVHIFRQSKIWHLGDLHHITQYDHNTTKHGWSQHYYALDPNFMNAYFYQHGSLRTIQRYKCRKLYKSITLSNTNHKQQSIHYKPRGTIVSSYDELGNLFDHRCYNQHGEHISSLYHQCVQQEFPTYTNNVIKLIKELYN